MLALAEEHGLFQVRDANVLLGLALATDRTTWMAGIEHLKRSLDAYRATGFRVFLSFYLAELAAACLRQGRLDESEAALHEAFETLARRLRAFLGAGTAPAARRAARRSPATSREAEAAFRKALDLPPAVRRGLTGAAGRDEPRPRLAGRRQRDEARELYRAAPGSSRMSRPPTWPMPRRCWRAGLTGLTLQLPDQIDVDAVHRRGGDAEQVQERGCPRMPGGCS